MRVELNLDYVMLRTACFVNSRIIFLFCFIYCTEEQLLLAFFLTAILQHKDLQCRDRSGLLKNSSNVDLPFRESD